MASVTLHQDKSVLTIRTFNSTTPGTDVLYGGQFAAGVSDDKRVFSLNFTVGAKSFDLRIDFEFPGFGEHTTTGQAAGSVAPKY